MNSVQHFQLRQSTSSCDLSGVAQRAVKSNPIFSCPSHKVLIHKHLLTFKQPYPHNYGIAAFPLIYYLTTLAFILKTKLMSSIFQLDGPLRIDPGETGLDTHSFAFVNTSGFPIHDFYITTFGDGILNGSPDIVEGGCTIETFSPSLPKGGKGVVVGKTSTLKKGADWKRSNDDGDAEETHIVLDKDKGIPPGGGVILTFKFDETLDGDEGITISPSRLLKNNKHAGIGGRTVEPPKPFTVKDLLELLGKVGSALPLGGIIGQVKNEGKTRFSDLAARDRGTGLAIEASLDKPYRNVRLKDLQKLPLSALNGMTEAEAEQLNCASIGDFVNKFEIDKLVYLMNLSEGC